MISKDDLIEKVEFLAFFLLCKEIKTCHVEGGGYDNDDRNEETVVLKFHRNFFFEFRQFVNIFLCNMLEYVQSHLVCQAVLFFRVQFFGQVIDLI